MSTTDMGSLASTQTSSPGDIAVSFLRASIAGKGHLSPRKSSSSIILFAPICLPRGQAR